MKIIKILSISCALLIGGLPTFTSAASICNNIKPGTKIWWDGVELKPGQIGRLTVLKDTPLYQLKGDSKVTKKVLKSGGKYRIYAFKPGMLSVGGGYYLDRDTKIKYETPSKTKLQMLKCANPEPIPPMIGIDANAIMYESYTNITEDSHLTVINYLNSLTGQSSKIAENLERSSPMIKIGDWVYGNYDWNPENSGKLMRINVKTKVRQYVTSGPVGHFSTDGQYIYYLSSDNEGKDVYKAHLDGTYSKKIATLPFKSYSYRNIFFSNGALYFYDLSSDSEKLTQTYEVYKLSKDGKVISKLHEITLDMSNGNFSNPMHERSKSSIALHVQNYTKASENKFIYFDPKSEKLLTFNMQNSNEILGYYIEEDTLYYSTNVQNGESIFKINGQNITELLSLNNTDNLIYFNSRKAFFQRDNEIVTIEF